jgi:hypothetical protein
VSKLLTGFDAPSCTYIYLDNELRDYIDAGEPEDIQDIDGHLPDSRKG